MSPLLAVALLLQILDLRPASACPYVVVTTSGEKIGSLDRPSRDGKPVKFRLCSNGTLTVFPARDVDWAATEAANASGPAAATNPALAPVPTKQTLSGIAKQMPLRDADAAVKQNQLSGKIKLGGREISLDDTAPFFGKESVAQYLRLSTFLTDTSGCPATRARAYGSVKNVSRFKLRNLRALVVIGSLKTGDMNGQVQTMDPADLVPGEEAEIFLSLSCDWAGRSSGTYLGRNDSIVALLPDVAGRVEEVEKPDGNYPFLPTKTPSSAKPSGASR